MSLEDKYPDIVCVLTYEVFYDPVITNKGITYEKIAIENWLLKNKYCPITREYLDKSLLMPNIVLKNLIETIKKNDNILNKINQINTYDSNNIYSINNHNFIKTNNTSNNINIIPRSCNTCYKKSICCVIS